MASTPHPARRRRICSYDMAEVPADAYVVMDDRGEMYFCSARCLAIWAVDFATKPNRPPEQKSVEVNVTAPTGALQQFSGISALAHWALATALQSG